MNHFPVISSLVVIWIVAILPWNTEAAQNTSKTPPHVIFIYADDLGWNDVSYHGSPQIPTPNIDALAMSGITLTNYYGQWQCTPSRGSLMTGKNAIRLGLQHMVVKCGEATALPLKEVTFPQYMKKLGYATHMVGKWHLGYFKKEYTPAHRGFDSFFGYYNGLLDYYDYVAYDNTSLKYTEHYVGIDLHEDTKDKLKTVRDIRGRFAPDLFTEKAEKVILNHNPTQPLFLYFPHLAVHFGVQAFPYASPPALIQRVNYIENVDRRIHAAKTLALDDSMGVIFKALFDKGMLENTIIVFASDNGGEFEYRMGASSNFPLRGKKYTLWEGGVRLPAIIWSPLFNLTKPRISKQLIHVTDWLPTIYKAAGGNPKDLTGIDGIDMWETLMKDLPSPRKEVLYNIDEVIGVSALRVGDMKVINGTNGNTDTWYNPIGNCFMKYKKPKNCHFEKKCVIRSWLEKSGMWFVKNEHQWRKNAAVVCGKPPYKTGGNCHPAVKPCLFNVTSDPCEHHNIADKHPEIVKSLMKKIGEYRKTLMPSQTKPSDPKANPQCHDFAHVPWMDAEYFNECTEYSEYKVVD